MGDQPRIIKVTDETVIKAAQLEIDKLMFMLKKYDDKLKTYMTEEEYQEWSMSLAKEAFFRECTNLPESAFKEFVLDNFKKIVGDE